MRIATVQLTIVYDDEYLPPSQWDWRTLLDIVDAPEVKMIDGPSLIPEETGQESNPPVE